MNTGIQLHYSSAYIIINHLFFSYNVGEEIIQRRPRLDHRVRVRARAPLLDFNHFIEYIFDGSFHAVEKIRIKFVFLHLSLFHAITESCFTIKTTFVQQQKKKKTKNITPSQNKRNFSPSSSMCQQRRERNSCIFFCFASLFEIHAEIKANAFPFNGHPT